MTDILKKIIINKQKHYVPPAVFDFIFDLIEKMDQMETKLNFRKKSKFIMEFKKNNEDLILIDLKLGEKEILKAFIIENQIPIKEIVFKSEFLLNYTDLYRLFNNEYFGAKKTKILKKILTEKFNYLKK